MEEESGLKGSSAILGFKRFIRRAGRLGSTAGRMPALREIQK
jgi:hypothetical protein